MPSLVQSFFLHHFARLLLSLACWGHCVSLALAQEPNSLEPNRIDALTARVSPVLEIEVVDPNQDARGNPAVVMTTDENGNPQVEIPPSLIVHRYYYTGDRSFRGPDLPGGPSIVVAQNPNTGSQVYLPVQMLPGSPIVHYSARRIEYDFGNRAVIVSFPKIGKPTVSYRNGRPLPEKAAKMLGVPVVKAAWQGTKKAVTAIGEKACTVTQAAGQAAGDFARPFTLPAQHLSRLVPGQVALTDPGLEARVKEQAAINQRNRELRQASAEARLDSIDIAVPR